MPRVPITPAETKDVLFNRIRHTLEDFYGSSEKAAAVSKVIETEINEFLVSFSEELLTVLTTDDAPGSMS